MLGAVFQTILRLAIGGVVWFGYMILAMAGAFFGNHSTGQVLTGLGQLLTIAVIVWAVLPIFSLFGRK